MPYLALLVAIICFFSGVSEAQTIEDIWNKYLPATQPEGANSRADVEATLQGERNGKDVAPASSTEFFPGRQIGRPQGSGEAAFVYPWKYRHQTYELHYENPQLLARSVYGLAIFTGDVSDDLPKETFYSSVKGFHYDIKQVCEWLNYIIKNERELTVEEKFLINLLIEDKFIIFKENTYSPGEGVSHLVAAAPGSSRSFANNLRHERLHVYWDEDVYFQSQFRAKWILLSNSEKEKVREKLKNYNQNNEQQLIEEWAIKISETENISITKE